MFNRHPVAIAAAGLDVIHGTVLQEVHIGGHRGVVFPDELAVAILEIKLPGDDDAGLHPAHGTPALRGTLRRNADIGHEIRIAAVLGLAVAERMEPAGEEGIDVHVVGGGAHEHLRITHPAETLVALRAVGRNREEVAALAPDDVLVEPVHVGIRRLKAAQLPAHRFQHETFHIRQRQGLVEAVDFNVTESVESEMGLEHFHASAMADIMVRCQGATIVLIVYQSLACLIYL